jgi:hypothetical protein
MTSLDLKTFEIITHLYRGGEQIYKDRCKECYSILDFEKIKKEISIKFPEITLFSDGSLFPKGNHPKYYKNNIIDYLSKYHSEDSELFNWITEYWSGVVKDLEEIDKSFDVITNTFVDQFIYLEKDPKIQDAFKILEGIKNDLLNESKKFVEEKVKKYIPENQKMIPVVIKEKILEQLRNNYLIIFKDICEMRQITDPELVETLFEMNGINISMIEFEFTLDYFIRMISA